jgi:hypothetical protein
MECIESKQIDETNESLFALLIFVFYLYMCMGAVWRSLVQFFLEVMTLFILSFNGPSVPSMLLSSTVHSYNVL